MNRSLFRVNFIEGKIELGEEDDGKETWSG